MQNSPNESTNLRIAVVLTLLAFIYALAQALCMHFTHDESISYLMYHGYEGWQTNPNNHFLNTHLMRLSQVLFGSSEWALRLPNLLAGLVFCYYLYHLLKEHRPLVFIAGFCLLVFNPLIDDFFPLARGYGLGMAALMASMYYLTEWLKQNRARLLHQSIFAASIALIANLSNLNFVLALLAVVFFLSLFVAKDAHYFKNLGAAWVLPLLSIATLAFATYWLFYFKKHGQLYYGAKSPFEALQSFVYRSIGFKGKLIYALAAIPVFLSLLALFFKPDRKYWLLLAIFVFMIMGISAEVFLFEIPYPKARTGLYLMVCLLLLTAMSLQYLPKVVGQSASLLVLAFTVFNFLQTASIDSTFEDGPGKNNKDVFKLIDQYQPKNVGISWTLEPSFNYYRISGKRKLEGFTRDGVGARKYDAYYGYQREIDPLVAKDSSLEVLKRYDDTKTVFVIRK